MDPFYPRALSHSRVFKCKLFLIFVIESRELLNMNPAETRVKYMVALERRFRGAFVPDREFISRSKHDVSLSPVGIWGGRREKSNLTFSGRSYRDCAKSRHSWS